MLENILKVVETTVSKAIDVNTDVPAGKKDQAVDVTTQSVTEGLKQNLTLDNIGNIANLFKSGSATENNPITTNIMGMVTASLTQKAGLSSSVSALISKAVVPLVMKVLSGKVNDPKDDGFSVESLIQSFSGGKQSGGGILDKISGLFGSK